MAQERAEVPVVNVELHRLKKLVPGVKVDRILDMLPFVALDIEGIEGGETGNSNNTIIRVEYNPNRPDFSTDYGIARALRGLFEIETGMPKFELASGKKNGTNSYTIRVERAVKKIRPHIAALVAMNGRLDDETIKQLIAMQEDLHNGIGRRRKKASIGIHNLDVIRFPIIYKTVESSFSFVPLGGSSEQTIKDILQGSEVGKQYGHILEGSSNRYPIIIDSAGTVLSFPPIINGNATRIDEKCRNLFVEVTATDEKTAEDILAIIAVTLYDAGFKIRTVSIAGGKETPIMVPWEISIDTDYVNNILGLKLDTKEMIRCLKKSRLDAKAASRSRHDHQHNNNEKNSRKIVCTIPRYRTDIIHPIDIVEEVAIGYGIYNMEPTFPSSASTGQKDLISTYFSAVRETMIGLGMLESLNFTLSSRRVQYESFGRTIDPTRVLSVEASKSIEHEILRDSLVPSLMQSLSRNVHEEYPQKLFEIGKTFHKRELHNGESADISITESWSVGAVVAHTDAGYTEIKSIMQSLLKSCFGKVGTTRASESPFFMAGRCAEIIVDSQAIGTIGEIVPLALENFKLRVPVAAFEINLSEMIKDK